VIVFGLNRALKAAVDRVKGQQMTQGSGVSEVIDAHDADDIRVAKGCTQEISPDTSESIDPNPNSHRLPRVIMGSQPLPAKAGVA